jgi:hypothetical protein
MLPKKGTRDRERVIGGVEEMNQRILDNKRILDNGRSKFEEYFMLKLSINSMDS